MKSFMKATKFVRISGPYRHFKISNDGYGHVAKLLETREFVVESYQPLTDEQLEFIRKVIDKPLSWMESLGVWMSSYAWNKRWKNRKDGYGYRDEEL